MTAKRNYLLHILDILDAIRSIEEFTSGIEFEVFLRDEKSKAAVVWKLTIIGEAAKRLPRELRQKYKGIPWSDMARMRDKISHDYFGIRYEIVWNVIKTRLPEIRNILQKMLDDLKDISLFE